MLMINTILRNFLKRPATRKYPMVKRDPFSNYRGRLINNVESCIFCRMCSTKCPAQCISTACFPASVVGVFRQSPF